MKAELERAIRDVVIANRILPQEEVVDAFGHVGLPGGGGARARGLATGVVTIRSQDGRVAT